MDKKQRKAIIKQKTIFPFIVTLVGALVMAACVFLPYSTATAERAEWIDNYPDTVVMEEMDLTAADMKNISLVKYAHIYYTMSEEYWHDSTIGIFYIVLVAMVGGGALIAALFASARKPFWCLVFGAISTGVFRLLNYDFTDRGVIPSDSYDWGIAHTIFPIAATVAMLGASWMLIQKIIVKRKIKAAPVNQE